MLLMDSLMQNGAEMAREDETTSPYPDVMYDCWQDERSPADDGRQTCQLFAFIVSFVLMGVTCTFGFAGNYLSVVTLGRDRSLRTSVTKFLLTVLAVADMAFLVPVVVVIMVPAYCAYGGLRNTCAPAVLNAIIYVKQYGWTVASAAHMSTVYITVLVAVHRYVYVCRPHDTERLSGLGRAKTHVAAVTLFAVVYNLPRLFEYRLWRPGDAVTTESCTNATEPQRELEFTEIGGSLLFQIVYKNVCFYLVMYLVPLTTLTFVTVRLVTTMRARRRRNGVGSVNGGSTKPAAAPAVDAAAACASLSATPKLNRRQQNRDDSVTFVLVVIIVVFIVCQTPTLVQRLMLYLSGIDGLACGHAYYYVEQLSDYLAIFNSCVNFVVYVVYAPHFRRILLVDVLRMRCLRHATSSGQENGEVAGGGNWTGSSGRGGGGGGGVTWFRSSRISRRR